MNFRKKGYKSRKVWYDTGMPNICTHIAFGVRVAAAVGKPLETLGDLFFLGCLGPDYYFYDRLPPTPFIPHQKKHGNALHALDCYTLFSSLRAHADPSLTPYLYGFLTHIALDSTLHPYIVSKHSGLAHSRFEGVIDSIVFEETKSEIPYEQIFRAKVDVTPVDALLSDVSQALFQKNVSGAYRRGFRKFQRLVPFLYDPDLKRYRFFLRLEKLIRHPGLLSDLLIGGGHEDPEGCMNLEKRTWVSPWEPDRVRNESVPELIDDAFALAGGLIYAFDADAEDALYALLRNRSMQKGEVV